MAAHLAAAILLVIVAAPWAPVHSRFARSLRYDEFEDSSWPNRHSNQFEAQDHTPISGWRVARATFAYNHDNMNIDNSACHYGKIDPNADGGHGLQAMAISDVNPEYAGSCGRCYEIRCANMVFTDNYNETIDRSNVCYDTTGSLVMKIVDTCPCNYQQNAKSNKRWCCGDMTHFDASYWAMLKLANPTCGVIGLNYREVPCNFTPAHDLGPVGFPPGYPNAKTYPIQFGNKTWFPAPPPEVTAPYNVSSPSGKESGKTANATRTVPRASPPYNMQQQQTQASPPLPPAAPAKSPSLQAAAPAKAPAKSTSTTDMGEYQENMMGEGSQGGIVPIYNSGSEQSGWSDVSYNVKDSTSLNGPGGSDAKCANVRAGGAIAFQGAAGDFKDMLSLAFSIRKPGGGAPDVDVNIGGNQGQCGALRLSDLERTVQNEGSGGPWSKYDVYLGNFQSTTDGATGTVEAFAAAFSGCGGLTSAQINKVEFINAANSSQQYCVDQVELAG